MIRGQPTEGTADELRKRLNQCFANNTAIDEAIVNALNTENELGECEGKFSDLRSLVDEYEGNFRDNEYHRILARLHHLALRIERIPVPPSLDLEPQTLKDNLLKKTKELVEALTHGATKEIPQEAEGSQEDLEESSNQEEKTSDLDKEIDKGRETKTRLQLLERQPPAVTLEQPGHGNLRTSGTKPNLANHSTSSSRSPSIPVFKWGLKYDFESGQSVGCFLQRVEELRRARGVSHTELFDSAVDLFSGQALVWYRSVQSRVSSWNELCQEMRTVFQTPDYDFRLQREIFNRTQGDHEPIDIYIASMEGLYARLAEPVPESLRLAQILNNIHPHLQDRLSLCQIRTLEELRDVGRKAEAGRFRAAFSRQQPRSGTFLEPDLAYLEPGKRRGLSVGKVASVQKYARGNASSQKCWNCHETGHKFSACQKERRMFCYGCGRENTTKAKCPSCVPKNV